MPVTTQSPLGNMCVSKTRCVVWIKGMAKEEKVRGVKIREREELNTCGSGNHTFADTS